MKIVFVMNVEWNWIKQRPHFIAQYLSENNDLSIMYQHRYRRAGLQNRKEKGLKLFPIYLIPKISGIESLRLINDILLGVKIKSFIKKFKPDLVYLTYPTQYYCIPKNYTGKVLYDCMDNHVAFYKKNLKYQIIELEKKVLNRSDYIFATSQYLKNLIFDRNKDLKQDITVIRNAFDGKIIQKPCSLRSKKDFKIAYFGTISSWFDFELILKSTQDISNISYYLYGPIDGVTIPKSEQIIYKGTVEHDILFNEMENIDILIMPFIVNEIIEAVDPVKLYEYINCNKAIISIYYDEIRRFEPYVNFYRDYNEYRMLLERIINGYSSLKYSATMREVFLESNSWRSRAEQIERIINA